MPLPFFGHVHELLQLLRCLAADAGLRPVGRRLQQRDIFLLRIAPQLLDAGGADAPLRHVDDALKGHIVRIIGQHLHVGQDVLDFLPLVEVHAAHHLIGNVVFDALLLHETGLGIGAVQYHLIPVRTSAALGLTDDRFRLILRALIFPETHRLPALLRGPETFFLPSRIVADDGIGRVQYALSGAIVLLQLDHPRAGIVFLEGQDVLQICAAEGIDALVIVSHHADVPVAVCQLVHQLELNVVGVLVLIHQNITEALLIVLQHLRCLLKQRHGLQQQVIKVQRIVRLQLLLVLPVAVCDPPHPEIPARILLKLLRIRAFVFGRGNQRQHLPLLQHLRIDVQGLQHLPHHGSLIICIINRKVTGIADKLDVTPQNPHAHAVEGGNPHLAGSLSHQLIHAVPHFPGRLVREGNGQNIPGLHAAVFDEIGDAVGQHPGFSASGTCQHQQRPLRTADRLRLLLIQNLFQIFHAQLLFLDVSLL